jgi:hypothetical protein
VKNESAVTIGIMSAAIAILPVLTLLLAIVFCVILLDVTSTVEIGDLGLGAVREISSGDIFIPARFYASQVSRERSGRSCQFKGGWQ